MLRRLPIFIKLLVSFISSGIILLGSAVLITRISLGNFIFVENPLKTSLRVFLDNLDLTSENLGSLGITGKVILIIFLVVMLLTFSLIIYRLVFYNAESSLFKNLIYISIGVLIIAAIFSISFGYYNVKFQKTTVDILDPCSGKVLKVPANDQDNPKYSPTTNCNNR